MALTMASHPRRPLGEILVSGGHADVRDVNTVLAHMGEKKKLASELYCLGVASERALATGLAEQHRHPAVVLSESSIDLTALDLLPRVVALQHGVLAVSLEPDVLTLAVAELSTLGRQREIFEHIESASSRQVVKLLAVESVLQEAIALAYDAQRRGEKVLVGAVERPPGVSSLQPLSVVRPQGTDDDPSPPLILVVDDDGQQRAALAALLQQAGCHVVEAAGGRAALELLRTLRPSLLVLEATLSELQGYEICRLVKASPIFEDVPVVMLSARMTAVDLPHADAVVAKPVPAQAFRDVVVRLLGTAHDRRLRP